MSQHILFHAGELAVQARTGEGQIALMNGRALSDRIPEGAIPFIAQQPMAVIASIDRDDSVWASVLCGEPGFLYAEDNRRLVLDAAKPRSARDDPLWENLRNRPEVGMLIIELGTRRRLRVNGRMRPVDNSAFRVDVEAAYPNCPKYIQRRHWRLSGPGIDVHEEPTRCGAALNPKQCTWIKQADTLFVASAYPGHGADASHRGGKPGFVQVLDAWRLRIPDYAGNSMFNTLGNFHRSSHAGLAFVDFTRGRLLQLSGRALIRWDLDDPCANTGGTGRFWDFGIERWRESDLPLRLEWEFLDYSPFIPATCGGDDELRLQIAEIRQETAQVKRFRLRAFDDALLPAFTAGAHLLVSLQPVSGEQIQRHYSILSAAEERTYYDIAVLKEPHSRGGSRYMHESVHTGDQLTVGMPSNAFPMIAAAEHVILIAGGIGITPILSMLRARKSRGQSYELHYSAKRWADLAFRDEIESLADERASFYATREADRRRIDLEALLKSPTEGVHVYVCGPNRLINSVRGVASERGWPRDAVHYESFGAPRMVDDRTIAIRLARSGKRLSVPADRTILDALLDAGHAIPHDCKRGECGLCVTPVLKGEPDHRDVCLDAISRETAMCVCVSRAQGNALVLDL